MSVISKPYKHPKSGIYYFRRSVPKSLRGQLGWEIKISLNTSRLNEAIKLFNVEQVKCEELFDDVRCGRVVTKPTSSKQLTSINTIVTLSHLLSIYKNERSPSISTMSAFSRAVRLFDDLYKNIPAASITRPMMREYKTLLLSIPRNLTHIERKQSLLVISKIKNRDRISSGSVNKYIKCISAILSWSEDNGYFDSVFNWGNPALGIRIKSKTNEFKRLPFDNSDLSIIFKSSVFSNGHRPVGGAGEAAFWFPLIALYTGARLEEIGQLLVSDIKQEEGIWYFDFNNHGDKKLKTKSSIRIVPIHSKLLDIGFLNYKNSLQDGYVFPKLWVSKDGRRTRNWSKWFGSYLSKLGINDKAKVFHSFRHLMKDTLRNADVDEAISDTITGHSSMSIGRAYGSGYNIVTLNKAMQSVRFDVLVVE